MDRAAIIKAGRTPMMIAIIGGTLVVFLIWMFAVFLPQGSKVSKLNAQAASLQTQQDQLNAKLRQLEKLKNSNLQHLHNQYSALVPATPSTSPYLKQINTIVGQSGVKLNSITLSTPVVPVASPSAAAAASAAGAKPAGPPSTALTINVVLTVTGTYDQNLQLMQLIYQAPRLTTISQVSLAGGGPTSNRGTELDASYTMTIYELPGTAIATTTTTTTAPSGL